MVKQACKICPLVFFLGVIVSMSVSLAGAEQNDSIIIDMLAGEPVPQEMMLDDLASVRIVYLGEYHTIKRHHKLQLDTLTGIADRKPNIALGMEMFSADQQEILDWWQSGTEDVAALIRKLGRKHWTNLQDYAAVLYFARNAKIPIIGLNAPDDFVRKVAREGLSGLTDEQRRILPKGFDKIDPAYDKLMRIRLKVHRAFHEKSLDNVVLAQAIRDAIMAQRVISFFESERGKDAGMVVIAGSGHINYGFGIPERVQEHLRYNERIVLASESGELKLSEEEKKQAMPVEITHEDLKFIQRPIADYLHIIPLRTETPEPEAEETSQEAFLLQNTKTLQ
ncbi:ChaN family lipoprotein [Desulfomonile tiedjei]|uniref:Uncharacterized iron-regulated protein n=1 Tax=Desulfomonile tiedjei (strain ATCC 49306 / DSM 6799 / DCB-1) TaxID=706587 RepID=I4C7L0_DESTA|nr:ChaN family lipoprotein [Desulfomonile tiedjei]AFM25551.1 uncharacterized iron-regulated protein [Desulfomonile tiedjei DSM 6799]